MNWLGAVATGAGLGVAFYGGLWLTVRGLAIAPDRLGWLAVSRTARLALVGVGFCALSLEGIELALAGMVGLLLARLCLLRQLGGESRG